MTNLRPVLAILLGCLVGVVHAESADRDRPIEITAQHFHGDEIHQKAVYSGHVEVHQGTLEVLSDRLEVVTDTKGYRTLTFTGKPVKIKERRDPKTPGVDEWVHAKSTKAIYREKNDDIVLSGNAKVSRTENGVVKDSTAGSTIVYDLLHAKSKVQGASAAGKKTRVTTTLSPRSKKQSTKKPSR